MNDHSLHPLTCSAPRSRFGFAVLDDVRSVARAKCVEDFEYFVTRCFGHTAQVERYVGLWQSVVQGQRASHGVVLSETFEWLFPELVERRASQREAA